MFFKTYLWFFQNYKFVYWFELVSQFRGVAHVDLLMVYQCITNTALGIDEQWRSFQVIWNSGPVRVGIGP